MDKAVEKKRAFIIKFIYLSILVGLYCFLIKYAMGYIFPFVFAVVLAIFLQPIIRKLTKKLNVRAHSVVSTLIVLLLVVLIVGVLACLGYVVYLELKDLIGYITTSVSSLDDALVLIENTLLGWVGKLPEGVSTTISEYITNFFDKFSSGENIAKNIDVGSLAGPLSGAWNVVKGIPFFLVGILVTVISCVFMTSEYDKVRDMILEMCSEETGKKLIKAKRTVTKGVGKLIKAYVTLMLITFTEVFIGLNLMKLIGVYKGGYIAIIAFVTCIVDIVPVLGTGTVLVPWAVYSLVTGNVGLFIGLLIMYVVVSVIRQAIEPKLVANQVGLPSIVTIMAMFLGGRLLGPLGILIVPLTVIVLKMMYDEGIIGNKKISPKIEKSKKK